MGHQNHHVHPHRTKHLWKYLEVKRVTMKSTETRTKNKNDRKNTREILYLLAIKHGTHLRLCLFIIHEQSQRHVLPE